MKEKRLNDLMQRYLAQECNADEKEELALLIDASKNVELESQLLNQWNKDDSKIIMNEDKTQQILSNILTSSPSEKTTHVIKRVSPFNIRRISAVAAAVLILISLGIFVNKIDFLSKSDEILAKASTISPQKEAPFVRNVTLPDGSTVVLHANSTIDYPKHFNGKTREISLVGEAYFDIKHDSKKPFIIHTGKVKTTVLGTAFDIKAWPDQKNVIVSVTRGKVRVENDNKVLAILTINQQIKYDLLNADTKQKNVNAEEIVNNWTKEEMDFDGATLESIAQTLSKRYGKDITIGNSQLAKTQIVSSFGGTESLENILEVLCTINSNTQYQVNDNGITISNKN